MCADIKSLQAFLYSKYQKCLKEISKFWKMSDEGTDMDSQDETDHGVCPTDPNVMAYKKKK